MGSHQQRRLFSFILLWLLFIPLIVRGDGKVFTQAVAIPVNTPDQRALLYYSNGVERLVIETSFVGEGTNFAWVVPLPSVPKIEAVSQNFFPSLSSSYQPILFHEPTYFAHICVILGAIISSSIFRSRRKGPQGLLTWLIFILAVFLLIAISIPNFVKARGVGTVPTASVTIIDQQKVGIYDTVTLSGTDGRSLLDWLNENQFYTPTNALPILSDYAARKWVFAAATIHREEKNSIRSQPHPLAFTFATDKAVYPLQLTGVENGSCTIELFVFGPDRAETDHFQAEYCGHPTVIEAEEDINNGDYERFFFPPKPGEFRIAQPEIRKFAAPAPVTTKLVGTLTPSQMTSDAWIRWVPFEELIPIRYSRDAAKGRAIDWLTGIVVIGSLLIQLRAPRLSKRSLFRLLISVVAVAMLAGVIRFVTLDITEVVTIRHGYNAAINNWRTLSGAMDQYALERRDSEPVTFETLTNALNGYMRGGVFNSFSYQPLLHEPSPGNITVREGTNGTEVFWYDLNGNPHWMITFKHKAK